MSDEVPFARRRSELIERAVAILSSDARFAAGWLEGSLADGTADAFSDIDLHLCVLESAWDEVWNNRLGVLETAGPIVASLDIMGVFGVGCLMAGPVKLDVFFERESGLASMPRVAVKRLWGGRAGSIRAPQDWRGSWRRCDQARAAIQRARTAAGRDVAGEDSRTRADRDVAVR